MSEIKYKKVKLHIEYKVVPSEYSLSADKLNSMAWDEGWELFAIIVTTKTIVWSPGDSREVPLYIYHFKRGIPFSFRKIE